MKIKHIFLFLAIGLFAACGDDDTVTNNNILSYDGPNQTAPELAPGDYELAVYFPASTMQQHIGKKLTEVEFYAGQAPEFCELRVHGPGTASSPGTAIYSDNVTNLVQGDARWVTRVLSNPVEITGEDLWIGLYVTHATAKQTIGCDAGPRKEGGDWIWNSATQAWETFLQRTGSDSVNWNIRGVLE